MSFRRALPSLATLLTFMLCGIASLFLIDALNNTNTKYIANGEPVLAPQRQQRAVPESDSINPVDLAALTTRPLFSPTRRIPEAVEIPAVEPPELVEDVVEEATPRLPPPIPPAIIMIGAFDSRDGTMALIKDEHGAESWVLAGDNLSGWQVMMINPKSITLQLDGESVDIRLID